MASRDTPKTVLLKGDPIAYEGIAGGTITPGMLLGWSSGKLVAHAVTGPAKHPVMVAREKEYAGGGIDTTYTTNERVAYYVMRPGDMFYGLLENGQNVQVGTKLASNAAGALEAAADPTGEVTADVAALGTYPVVEAMEAVNNSSGGNVRIKVRVL